MNKQNSIVILCLMAFVLLSVGCAMQRSNSAGRINGVYINRQDFINSLRGHYTGFQLEKGRPPDDEEKKEIYRNTWKNITTHIILKDYFRKYQIQVAQNEVIDTLLNNVPETMLKAPIFQKNGKFDKSLYTKMLLSDELKQLDWLKRYYYDYYIPIAKLKIELQKSEIIGRKDLHALNDILNSTVDVKWIVWDTQDRAVRVSQSEIESYYHSNIKDFEQKPYANIGWTTLPVKPSTADEDVTKIRIDSIYVEILGGKSFSLFPEKFSNVAVLIEDSAADYVRIDDIPTEIKEAVLALQINEVTRPIKYKNIWVMYQLLEITKNLVKLNEIAIRTQPGEITRNEVKEKAIQLRNLALQLGLLMASSEMNNKYKISGIVTQDSIWTNDPNISAYLIDRAYTQKAGAILEPVYSDLMIAWIVAEVIEVQSHKHKPLLTVTDEISLHLRARKQQAGSLSDAEDWLRLNRKIHLDAASRDKLHIINTPVLKVNDTLFEQPISGIFVSIIKDYQSRKALKPYVIGSKVAVPVVSEVKRITPPILSYSDVRAYYFEKIDPNWFDRWLNHEVKKADVKIWFSYP